MKKGAEVDAYIAAFPKEIAAGLSKVRRAIQAAAPKATEGISYRIPLPLITRIVRFQVGQDSARAAGAKKKKRGS